MSYRKKHLILFISTLIISIFLTILLFKNTNIYILLLWCLITPYNIWFLILAKLKFPETNSSSLIHYTTNWEEIRKSKTIYPTADAAIYFSDYDKDLSNFSKKPKKKIIIENAKQCHAFKKIEANCFSWKRLKMGLGEWTSKEYLKLNILEYKENENVVTINKYSFEEVEERKKNLLKIRNFLAKIFLCIPLISFSLSCIALEMYLLNSKKLFGSYSSYVFLFFISAWILGYFLQKKFNEEIFRE